MTRLLVTMAFALGLGCGAVSGEACLRASDFHAEGDCDAEVGYFWTGEACIGASGCDCTGADCGRWDTEEACLDAHRACTAR